MDSRTLTKAEQEHMAHMEQLRIQGHEFFTIVFTGPVKRIHSLKNISVQEGRDPVSGEVTYTPIESDRVVEPPDMLPNPATGRYEARVYNDPEEYNLFWLSRNAESLRIEIPDEKIRKRVERLQSEPFKLPEGEKELLLVEKRRIERQLRAIEKREKDAEEEEKRNRKGKLKPSDMKTDAIRPEPEKYDKFKIPFTKV